MYKKLLIFGLCFGLMNAGESDFRKSRRINKEYKAELLDLSNKIESANFKVQLRSIETALWFILWMGGIHVLTQIHDDLLGYVIFATIPIFNGLSFLSAVRSFSDQRKEIKLKCELEAERARLLKNERASSDDPRNAL